MEIRIVWALIATLGTWVMTSCRRGDGVRSVAVAGGNEPHAGLLGRSHASRRASGPCCSPPLPARWSRTLSAAVARRHTGLFCLEPSSSGHLTAVTCVSRRSERGNGANRVVLLILAITLHNIPEGLAVGVAFGALQRGASPEAVMGAISIAFGIGLQNFPEGAAVSVPLRREGAGRLRSFLLGQASGLVEPVAGVLGALLVGSVEAILPYALAFAAGAMILVAVHELIPECQRNREARPYTATMGIVAGFAIMMLLDVALG